MITSFLLGLYRVLILTPVFSGVYTLYIVLSLLVVIPLCIVSLGLSLLLVPVAQHTGSLKGKTWGDIQKMSLVSLFGTEIKPLKHFLELIVFYPYCTYTLLMGIKS